MDLRKNVYPQQSIKGSRHLVLKQEEKGQIEWLLELFLLLFFVVFLCGILQLDMVSASSAYLEDALAASNLASAVIDLKEYGMSHEILVENPTESYQKYQFALKENLNLDNNWECDGKAMIAGKVEILHYIVFNVKGTEVEIYHFDRNGQLFISKERLGEAQAPNGRQIESTSIYSEICYPVKGFCGEVFGQALGIEGQAHKGKLVDIVAEN